MNKEEIDYIINHEGSEIEEFVIDGYNFRKLLLQLTETNEKLEKIKDIDDLILGTENITVEYLKRQFRDILEIIKGSDIK